MPDLIFFALCAVFVVAIVLALAVMLRSARRKQGPEQPWAVRKNRRFPIDFE